MGGELLDVLVTQRGKILSKWRVLFPNLFRIGDNIPGKGMDYLDSSIDLRFVPFFLFNGKLFLTIKNWLWFWVSCIR